MEAKVVVTTELQLKAIVADAVSTALKYYQPLSPPPDADPYGDFKWLTVTCSGIPASTLRIKSAAGDIPGVFKFGKRVLYDKVVVLNWLRSQTRQVVDMAKIEHAAELQVDEQLNRKGGKAK